MTDKASESDNNKSPESHWWKPESDKLSEEEALGFLQANKERLEKTLASINEHHLIYRTTNRIFSLFSFLASIIDRVKNYITLLLLKIPAPKSLKQGIATLMGIFDFKATVEFFRTKLYSLKKAPHNVKAVQLIDDVIASASSHGLDIKKHFPDIAKKFSARKNQFLQHSFFKEFSKSSLERLLAIPFSFNRSISPVLADTAMWHRFYAFLEKKNIKDIILVGEADQKVSLKNDSQHAIATSQVVRTLYEASVLKATGHRIFIIGHHEGYLGPYFVRSVLRQLGFDNLAANCNTVVGPRMFSNIVLKSGASNVGNLFLTLPSQKTTQVREKELATALMKSARRTQFLIKMPDAGLKLIEKMNYSEFMNNIVHDHEGQFTGVAPQLDTAEQEELDQYMDAARESKALDELDAADYYLFKSLMHEPFLIFPEGSRSYNEENGDITMKYVNPRFMQAYLRPGDVILPINIVGGSDITNGWRLSPATLGVSVAKPYSVTAEMIEHYETEGLNVMRTIAALPNIKNVHFDEDVQSRKRRL
ncbi:hypothetical protein [Alkalimarinus alittae]|uniref:Uncharacterized protein n=1 Tax=Alkalimarinus alittae TaxID=2961619 RepID=A0ABY6N348_9ALTE|nr:hypothetical protein [Alkalimarinus alittae]UZE96511.1 hypothetical protein NKI27_01815 [Alkalimarinus alittae]